MNSKQLANVLIKILGVSVFVHSIPSLLLLVAAQIQTYNAGMQNFPVNGYANAAISPVSMLIIGACLVVASRVIADWLFGNEDGQP
jgi:hypothetical protein